MRLGGIVPLMGRTMPMGMMGTMMRRSRGLLSGRGGAVRLILGLMSLLCLAWGLMRPGLGRVWGGVARRRLVALVVRGRWGVGCLGGGLRGLGWDRVWVSYYLVFSAFYALLYDMTLWMDGWMKEWRDRE